MNKLLLLTCLTLSLLSKARAQDTLLVDENTIQTPRIIELLRPQKFMVVDAKTSFVLFSKASYQQVQKDSAAMQSLITKYEQKDLIRIQNINSLNQFYDELLQKYLALTQRVEENIKTTNLQLNQVQVNLKSAKNEILSAQSGIGQAKTDISNASSKIDSAKDDINVAIGKLESVKKGNGFWIPALAGAGGLLLGILIGKK